MSKIALTGNASGTGTLTIAAPSTNTDRTLTLPDEAGTVLTSASDVAASQITTALNATGSAPIYAARAWVNFNGTGTVAIKASGNVSSITDVGVGTYTVNLTTAMPDTNYACAMATKGSSGAGTPFHPIEHASLSARTTSSISLYVLALSGATPDADTVEVMIFR